MPPPPVVDGVLGFLIVNLSLALVLALSICSSVPPIARAICVSAALFSSSVNAPALLVGIIVCSVTPLPAGVITCFVYSTVRVGYL